MRFIGVGAAPRALAAALAAGIIAAGATARAEASAVRQSPAADDHLRTAVNSTMGGPIEHPAERRLRELTRAALGEEATIPTWTSIARTVRELREADPNAVSPEAEAAARDALEVLARETPGAVGRIEVNPVGPHTEIVVSANGEVRHRLFQRLSDTTNPRLTMVLTGASYAIVEKHFDGIERGGVRAIEVTEFGADTVQIAVGLQTPSPFTIFRRDDSIVLRIENPDGAFEPWSSRGQWAGVVAATGAAGLRIAASDLPAASAVAVAGDEPRNLADDGHAGSSIASDGATLPVDQDDTARRASISGEIDTLLAYGALAVLGVVLLAGAVPLGRSIRNRWTVASAARRSGTKTQPANLAARARTRSPEASRIWAARTLAANGESPDEIARKTGLARDAVLLLAPSLTEAPSGGGHPAEAAGPGTFFPDGSALAGAGMKRPDYVTH